MWVPAVVVRLIFGGLLFSHLRLNLVLLGAVVDLAPGGQDEPTGDDRANADKLRGRIKDKLKLDGLVVTQ